GFESSTLGKYALVFNKSYHRQDATMSLKSGVKELDDAILNSISVQYDGNEIKKYTFQYEEGSFFKTRLLSLKEYRNNQFFYEHVFDYYSGNLTYNNQQNIIYNDQS